MEKAENLDRLFFDRRDYVRYMVNVPAKAATYSGISFGCSVAEISVTGIRIRGAVATTPGTRIKVFLEMDPQALVVGRVIWASLGISGRQEFFYEMGIEIRELTRLDVTAKGLAERSELIPEMLIDIKLLENDTDPV